jgi:hypothetical protein
MKKYPILAFLLAFLLGSACAQNSRIDGIALGPKGSIAFASVAVCTQPASTTTTPCSPAANLCASVTDAVCTSPNPLLSDVLGNYHFYVKQTQVPVTVQIYGANVISPYVLTDQTVGATLSGNNTFTGNNTWTGTNTWQNISIFNGNVTFNGLVNGGSFGGTISLANQNPTGTTLDTLTVLTGGPSTGIIAPVSTVNGIVGVCVSNCTAAGNAVVQQTGITPCVFDGATTANDYVVASTTVTGNCHDSGVVPPTKPPQNTEVIGQVLSSNGAGGTYNIVLTLQAPLPANLGVVNVTSLACALVSKTANYTLTTSDCIVQGSVSGGAFTLTLPHTATGQLWTITRTDSSANNLTIAGDSGTVNGQASVQVPQNHTTFCHADGANSWCTDQNTRDFSASVCTPPTSTDSQCGGTITISPPFADASYVAVLQLNNNSPGCTIQSNCPQLVVAINGTLTTNSIPYAVGCTNWCGTIAAPTVYVHAWHP